MGPFPSLYKMDNSNSNIVYTDNIKCYIYVSFNINNVFVCFT